MQPYAHGEELTPSRYLTFNLQTLSRFKGPLDDACIRLDLAPGESPPDDLDCAQLQIRRVSDADAQGDVALADVAVEDFDLKALYDESCKEADVAEAMQNKLWTYFEGETI
jgi:hypothetical protein